MISRNHHFPICGQDITKQWIYAHIKRFLPIWCSFCLVIVSCGNDDTVSVDGSVNEELVEEPSESDESTNDDGSTDGDGSSESDESTNGNEPTGGDEPTDAPVLSLIATEGEATAVNIVDNAMKVRIIVLDFLDNTTLFPDDGVMMVRELAEYTNTFFVNELERYGYQPRTSDIFARNSDGHIIIYGVHAPTTLDEFKDQNNSKRVAIDYAKAQYVEQLGHLENNAIWWIMPFGEFGSMNGGGSVVRGESIGSLPSTSLNGSEIDLDMAAPGWNRDNAIKGLIHELGHALTLPHNGPSAAQMNEGTGINTLMGATNNGFENQTGLSHTKVELSRFSAAQLSKHPVFQESSYQEDPRIVNLDFSIHAINFDPITQKVTVNGNVGVDIPNFHSMILLDNGVPNGNNGRWNRGYVVSVSDMNLGSDGSFHTEFSYENEGIDGLFRFYLAFSNGLVTGIYESHRPFRQTALEVRYDF